MTIVRTAAFAASMMIGAAATAASPEATTRFLCTLAGGVTTVVAHDLAADFGTAATQCVPIAVVEAAPQDLPPRPVPVPAPTLARRTSASVLVSSPYADLICDAAKRHRLNPNLLAAIIHVESRHRANARSRKGALGLMQIMPATGARYGVYQARNLYDPALNVDVGARYVNDLLDTFGGSLELTLAAYNAGEGAVARYGNRVPPFPETQRYVVDVMALLR